MDIEHLSLDLWDQIFNKKRNGKLIFSTDIILG